MPIFVRRDGIVIDRNRQRRRGLTPAGTPKAIAKSSEQKRSGFARDAGKSQQNGCQNAPIRGRHDDGNDGFPLASAKGHGTFAEGDRNGAEELLGAAERDGNHHQAESKSARKGREMLERQNGKTVSEDPDDNRGHTVQQISRIRSDEAGRGAAKLRKIDGTEKADRHAHEHCQHQQLSAADNGGGHTTAGFAHRGGQLGKEDRKSTRLNSSHGYTSYAVF